MANIEEKLEKAQLREEMQAIHLQAAEMFAPRPFIEQYLGAYKVAKKARYAFGAISVLSGFAVVLSVAYLPLWLIAPAAVLLLLAIEYAKDKATLVASKAYFKGKSSPAFIISALAFTASVSLSAYGAFNMGELMKASRLEVLKSEHASSLSGVGSEWDERIKEAQKTADDFRSSNLVKVKDASGKWVQVLSDRSSVKTAYGKLVEDVSSLRAQKLAALAGKEAANAPEAEEVASRADAGAWLLVFFSLANEALMACCICFVLLYQFRAWKDPMLAKKIGGEVAKRIADITLPYSEADYEEADDALEQLARENRALREERDAMRESIAEREARTSPK